LLSSSPLVQSALRSFQSLLRSFQSWLRASPWESALRDARRLARRPSGLALGVGFGAVAVAGALLAVVSAGSAAPAVSVSDQEASGHAWPASASGHGGHALPGRPGAAARPAAAAPAVSRAAAAAPAVSRAAAAAPAHSHAAARHLAAPAAPAAPARPYLIYDSVTPPTIPARQQVVATYADGPHPVPASAVTGRKSVLWISITGHDYSASVVDVEPGNATPAQAAAWAQHRLSASPHAIARIYTMIREWPAVQAAVASFSAQMRERIHWWIADPTGRPHLVTGSDATQWYWGSNYDITTAKPGF
jgi:hypothetical protein